jgi:hypothetical protein
MESRAEAVTRSHRISSEAFHTATGWRAKATVAEGLRSVPQQRQ